LNINVVSYLVCYRFSIFRREVGDSKIYLFRMRLRYNFEKRNQAVFIPNMIQMKGQNPYRMILLMMISLIILTSCEKRKDTGLPTDGDGNAYDTVVIGTQVWLKENLKTTKYNNGWAIPLVTDNAEWTTYPIGAYCWYNNDPTYKDEYGALYNWHAARVELLCPVGWHTATEEEWITMINYLGGESNAGGKLKETGFTHWQSPNEGATNETGFTARAGGMRYFGDGSFRNIRSISNWWTSTPSNNERSAHRVDISYIVDWASTGSYRKNTGYSVRCIKDN